MTTLSDRGIDRAVRDGAISVTPWRPENVQPASLDVTLDHRFRVFSHRHSIVDSRDVPDDLYDLHEVATGNPFVLYPGAFVLGSTVEVVSVAPHMEAILDGRSSLGRLGVVIHATAGYIDPGFSNGQITLELSSYAPVPVMLWPGDRVGQLRFARISSACRRPYGTDGLGSRYQGQRGPTPSLGIA